MSKTKKNDDISIRNLLPRPAKFKLAQFPDFEFKLKPCTGGMLVNMANAFGDVESLLSTPSVENISKIAMSLLEHEGKTKFKMQEVKVIDNLTGEETDEKIGGYILLMHSIRGTAEQYSIYGAILKSMGYSDKDADGMMEQLHAGVDKLVNDKLEESKNEKK